MFRLLWTITIIVFGAKFAFATAKCTGPNEYFSDDDICECEEGYTRDDDNICVPIPKCSQELCGDNEVATSCFEAVCEHRKCSDLLESVSCVRVDPKFCTNGCLCKGGYLRAENGTCVPIDKCPNIKCGPNETYDVCPSQCPGELCGVDPSVILCLPNPVPGDPECTPGCRCQDNYFRNEYGFCVTKDQCPKPSTVICGQDEEPTDCVNGGCGIWYCAQTQEICNLMLDDDCKEGCHCKDGMLRTENGTCVPADQCPTKCNGPNEYFSCGGACDNVCATLKEQNQTNCPIVNKKCNPKCYCQEGYARDDNNICIPIKKCPPLVCGINEIYDACIAPCPPRRCDVDERLIRCARPPQPGDPACQSGCRCADNFYRNHENVCVPRSECQKCPKNERPTSCSQAICERRNCSDLLNSVICVRIDPKFCTDGCLCNDGYLRDEKGTCIPINQCPEAKCKDNEIFDACPSTCPGEQCGVDPRLALCAPSPEPGDPSCQPRCRCADGYLRNNNGKCVPKDKCPKPPGVICGADEVYNSCVNGGCGRWNCSQPGIICIDLIEGACREGCRCKGDLLRASNGSCIPADQCPPVCGINEIFDDCPATCPPRTCDALNRAYKCKAPPKQGDPECKPSCRCADNHYRNEKGVCVPRNECLNCFGQNEVKGCKSVRPQTCENIGNSGIQPRISVCIPECRCKEGYFRNKLGQCISREDCLKCTGPNEYFSCGGACDNVCATLAEQNQTNCPIVNIVCNKMCYCEKGYARDNNNTCVPISQCPQQKCPKNERPTSCIQAKCERRYCSDLLKSVACVRIDPKFCTDGCLCVDGYLRTENGTCVPINQCPEAKCKDNEIFDACPSTCPGEQCGVDPRLVLCAPNPEPGDPSCQPRCRCAEGYLKNTNGKCIPKDKCPKPPGVICGADEVYNSCVNGGCGRWNCSQPGIICIDLIEGACREGCRCKGDLLRASNGSCIPADQCPLNCYGENEVRGCKSTCPQTCESIGKKYSCPLQPADCTPDCRCKTGFFRNNLNECISKEDCLKCTGPNEYFSCGGACDNVCATLAVQNQTNCPIVNIVCNKMCYCEEGYARDNNNTCVHISQCPQPVCGINEIFDDCPATCPPKTCDALNRAYKCKAPPKLGDPECKPSCRCADNHYRNEKGVCVPRNECLNCFGQNEVRGCKSIRPQTCESMGKTYPIDKTTRISVCIPECRCKEGYLRSKVGQCISKEDCLKCTGPNEYFSCGGACDNVCATLAEQNQTKCPIVNIVCNRMCYCEEGYARDKNNICVPISQCPQYDNTNNGLKEFEQGNVAFTEKFLYEAAKANPGVSLIFSPFSVLFLLAQLALYAEGALLEQLLGILNLKSKAKIRSFLPNYLDTLGEQQNVTFNLVEKIFATIKLELSENFQRDTRDVMKAEAQSVDFCKAIEAARTMNEWVEHETNNLIQDLVSPDSLDCDTVLVLINAIYFKGKWKKEFMQKNTKPNDFYADANKTVQVNMMSRTGSYKYAEISDLDAQVIELPYESANFSFLICLPKNKTYGIYDLLDKLKYSNYSLSNTVSNMTEQTVDLSLPVFNSTTTTDLKELLNKANAGKLFEANSGLTGIFKDPVPTYVSSATQKAVIIVNESGSEAAAANAFVVGITSVQENRRTEFIANHPFIYYILYKGTPIFCGIYFGDV